MERSLDMKDVEKRRGTIINVIYFAMILAIAFLLVRYALGVCLPFMIAFVLALLVQRPKNFLVRKTFLKNGAASVICVFLLLIVLVALVSLIGVRVFAKVQDFVNYIAMQFQNVESVVDNIQAWLMSVIAKLPEFLRNTLNESATDLFAKLHDYINSSAAADTAAAVADAAAAGAAGVTDPTVVAAADAAASSSGGLAGLLSGSFKLSWITTPLSSLISTAKQIPSMLITVVITLVASCFMATDFDKMMNFFKLQFPERRRADVERAKVLLKTSLGKMARAYALIMLVTFIEMSVGLTVLKLIGVYSSNYILMVAAVTAIVDIVPVLGTGTIVLPWAVYSFITGNFGMGIGLIILYAAITVIRQFIEPKLVAGQLGLSPIVTITALYLGLKAFGVLGMLVTPLLVIMLKLLNDEGIIHLWKSPARVRAAQEAAAAAESEGEQSTADPPAEESAPPAESGGES